MGIGKGELISRVQEEAGLASKADTKLVIEAVLDVIQMALVDGDNVTIVGFGTFKVSARAAREGRNPQTGATVQIAARNAVTFKPSAKLKESVNA